ncbi:MAG TPA: serine hydrolase [Terriglobia bacterium]|jgi:CubicO group peptidase (beta-lactamase class C family)
MDVQAYHGVSASVHQSNVTNLSGKGYGMISLSVYGDTGDPQYAAVWVNRPMPKWAAVHGISPAVYQSWVNTWVAKGYGLSLVSVTGSSPTDAIFAAVMTEGAPAGWSAQHGLSENDFNTANATALANRKMPLSVAIYGEGGNRTYAGVWWPNPGFVKWMVNPSDPAAAYQTTFNVDTQLPGYTLNAWRPAYVAHSGDQTYCSVFRDDVVDDWFAFHGLTAAQYQTEFDNQKKAGRYPICVQGGGSGNSALYAAVFAKNDVPEARQWTAAGTAVPAQANIDAAFKTFMQANGIRAAQMAFGKNGTMEFARGYTWAEPGYRVTQPSDRFLLASCSKMFCEAAIQSLFDAKKLAPGDYAFAKIGISNPGHTTNHDSITVQHLLDHKSGYDDGVAPYFDPTYKMGQVALAIGVTRPTRMDICKYMYGQPLQHTPGATYAYSNFGYLFLATLVEKVSGTDYFTYLNSTLLAPAGITEVQVISTAASGRNSNEAIAEDPALGANVLAPNSSVPVPQVYGGDGEINEVGVGNDGMGASARALAQFAHLHAVWGNGPRSPGSARDGSTPGASTYVWSRGDGVDAGFTLNTRTWPAGANPVMVNGKVLLDSNGNPVNIVDHFKSQIDALLP